jgi:hypothetical protein
MTSINEIAKRASMSNDGLSPEALQELRERT